MKSSFKNLFGKKDKQTENLQLEISGMTCNHCAAGIERMFAGKKGMIAAKVDYPSASGSFSFDPAKISKDEIIDLINQTGSYEVVGEKGDEKKKGGYDYDLIVIGGGSAAFSAALRAHELGGRSLILNAGLPTGGTCVNVGCVPSKFLLRAAESVHRAGHIPFEGIRPHAPQVDFGALIRQKKALVDEMRQRKYLEVVQGVENIDIRNGYASFVDAHTVSTEQGETFTAGHVLIATGASTHIPDIPGLEQVDYLTNESLFELETLPGELLILGAGYIGLEIAQAYRRLGAKVTVLQRSSHILSSQQADISDALAAYLKAEGIAIHTGLKFEQVQRQGEEVVVAAQQQGAAVSFRGTHLLVATGTRPNTARLNLAAAGLTTDARGYVEVNERQQTAVPHIFAAGDCIHTPAYVYTAALEGKVAAENAFGLQSSTDYTALPWVVFTDPQVAGVGMDEAEAARQGIPHEVTVLPLSEVPRAIAARDTRGFIKLIRNPETDQLLGARILAPEGGELVMEVSLAIRYGITTEQLANALHPYLTLAEGIKLAAITFRKDVKQLSCCAV